MTKQELALITRDKSGVIVAVTMRTKDQSYEIYSTEPASIEKVEALLNGDIEEKV